MVNNDPTIRMLVSDMSRKFAAQLVVNGKEGIDKALELNLDVILMDINMPEIDGIQVCQHLKEDRDIHDCNE